MFKIMMSLALLSVLISADSPNLKTGQVACYDNTSGILCPVEGEDFYGTDGNYQLGTARSYTRGDGNDSVIDNTMGLQWQDNANPASGNWDYATQYCSDLQLETFNDWRLATIKELATIVYFGRFTPTIFLHNTAGADGFAYTKTDNQGYWASSVYLGYADETFVWEIDFYAGYFVKISKGSIGYVRCVRNVQ